MAWTVERSVDADCDLEALFDFLVESYAAFGEPIEDAFDRAANRILKIEDAMAALALAPHQGVAREDLLAGLRSVTKDRAIFYFTVDDDALRVRVLAVFFGGQDHQRRMLARLAQKP